MRVVVSQGVSLNIGARGSRIKFFLLVKQDHVGAEGSIRLDYVPVGSFRLPVLQAVVNNADAVVQNS